ncbi:hypothetical protein OF83DRAFT_1179865 [Amylostereum chailletii]|nr:hypothetical protein OF83DRAFT_1179865 [Amylostereum chailletii]
MTLSIVLTILLVTRLLYMRHQVISAMGSHYGQMYASIASMLVESALPYGVFSFIFIILYGIQNTATNLFIPLLTQVECIAPMLIVIRVSRGDAMSSDTVQRAHTMSSSGMQFAANNAKATEGASVNGGSFPNGSSKTAFSSMRKVNRDPEFHLKMAEFPVGTEFHVTQFEKEADGAV